MLYNSDESSVNFSKHPNAVIPTHIRKNKDYKKFTDENEKESLNADPTVEVITRTVDEELVPSLQNYTGDETNL